MHIRRRVARVLQRCPFYGLLAPVLDAVWVILQPQRGELADFDMVMQLEEARIALGLRVHGRPELALLRQQLVRLIEVILDLLPRRAYVALGFGHHSLKTPRGPVDAVSPSAPSAPSSNTCPKPR
eukprot:4392289-Prymnesium_polylepis.1